MSFCMATKELNSDKFEPTANDPGQCYFIMQGIRLAIEHPMAACPGFANQLLQLLVNKGKAVDMFRNNQCWSRNC